jgi:hypothetical protein
LYRTDRIGGIQRAGPDGRAWAVVGARRIDGRRWSGRIVAVPLRLLYLLFLQVPRLVLLLDRPSSSKDMNCSRRRTKSPPPDHRSEINLLRHLRVLSRGSRTASSQAKPQLAVQLHRRF